MLKRRVVEGISACVVILETGGADESFLRELLSMLSRRTDFHAIKVHQGLTSGSFAIANIVSRIRKKLNPDSPKDGYIKTVVNGGYKFEV